MGNKPSPCPLPLGEGESAHVKNWRNRGEGNTNAQKIRVIQFPSVYTILFQPDARNERGWNFTKLPSPAKRGELWMFRWKGTFFESIEDKSVLEGDIEVILNRTVEIQLRFRLVAQSEPL
jgi:hypothetical protein